MFDNHILMKSTLVESTLVQSILTRGLTSERHSLILFSSESDSLTHRKELTVTTRNRSDEDKAKVRKAMLEAAGELLVKEGYDGLTLAKVGKRVGFTTTNVYRYFENKNDLIYAAIEDAFVEFGERLEEAKGSTDDPLERIFALGRAYVKFAFDHPAPYYLMFVDKTDYLFGEREVPGVDKLGYLFEAVGEAMQAGVIRQGKVEAVAHVLWGQLHGLLMLTDAMPFINEAQGKEGIEEAFEMIRAGLKPSV